VLPNILVAGISSTGGKDDQPNRQNEASTLPLINRIWHRIHRQFNRMGTCKWKRNYQKEARVEVLTGCWPKSRQFVRKLFQVS
jgi:hypothetical protein